MKKAQTSANQEQKRWRHYAIDIDVDFLLTHSFRSLGDPPASHKNRRRAHDIADRHCQEESVIRLGPLTLVPQNLKGNVGTSQDGRYRGALDHEAEDLGLCRDFGHGVVVFSRLMQRLRRKEGALFPLLGCVLLPVDVCRCLSAVDSDFNVCSFL